MEPLQKRRTNAHLFQKVFVGLAAVFPFLAVAQVYVIVASWLDMPARLIVHIPFLNHFFERVPFFRGLQQLFGTVLVFMMIIALLFLTGTFVMKKTGKKLQDLVETHLLSLIPLYNFFKKIVTRFGGEDGDVPFLARFERPVFVHVFNSETFQSGLITAGSKHHVHGIYTVCIPPAPNILAGTIVNVPAQHVHFLSMSTSDVVSPVAAWGVGTDEIIAHYVRERVVGGRIEPECGLKERCPLERAVYAEALREKQELQL